MRPGKIIISGTGCALADFLYTGISFNDTSFRKYLSKQNGDGGLSPGKLVFTEELEQYAGIPYQDILNEITHKKKPAAFNVGGPALVSMIHASQMLERKQFEVRYFGMAGNDETSKKIFEIISKTPLNTQKYLTEDSGTTPFTDVFSDSSYGSEGGERTFVNNIGVAWEYSPEHLNESFFESNIVCFGGTALVPRLHDNLTYLLSHAKRENCLTVVNTVFDFRNEKAYPERNWPLGNTEQSLSLIDILIMDCEEALRISGQKNIENAADYFASSPVASFIITNGADDLYAMSGGKLFKPMSLRSFPVSKKVKHDLKMPQVKKGDTTGCGDNFAGSIIASIAKQMKNKPVGYLDLYEAITWGIAAGGFTCFIMGGTYLEEYPGEKYEKIAGLRKEYLQQDRL